MSYFWGWGDDVEVTILDVDARVRSARRVTMGGPVSVHDCAITERFIVLLDLPVTFSMEAAAAGRRFPYRWQEGYHARVGLLPRDGDSTDAVWHDVEPCYVFHPLNAFDEPVATASCSTWCATPPCSARSSSGRPRARRRLERWHLDGHGARREGGAPRRPRPGVPPVDERGWACRTASATRSPSAQSDDIVGTESVLSATTSSAGPARPGRSARGARSARRSSSRGRRAAEDDGWLMTLVYTADTDTSALYVLHAGDIDGRAPGRRGAAAAGPGRLPRQLGAGPDLSWT